MKISGKSLKKGFIRKFQLLIGYLNLFILKKNRIYGLYKDYQKLNNVKIKTRYLLSDISKL